MARRGVKKKKEKKKKKVKRRGSYPIVPPMAIICTCRGDRDRRSLSAATGWRASTPSCCADADSKGLLSFAGDATPFSSSALIMAVRELLYDPAVGDWGKAPGLLVCAVILSVSSLFEQSHTFFTRFSPRVATLFSVAPHSPFFFFLFFFPSVFFSSRNDAGLHSI